MPFAQNEATRFISPTKTPEYLAGGKPVVSTPIRDVVRTYGEQKLVFIGSTPKEFTASIKKALAMNGGRKAWLKKVDKVLSSTSWDQTWQSMSNLVQGALEFQAV
jgi:UDP-galactopyranose mutase